LTLGFEESKLSTMMKDAPFLAATSDLSNLPTGEQAQPQRA
jgi:hypothetical protein